MTDNSKLPNRPSATSRTDLPASFSATAKGGMLDVSWTNHGTAPIQIASHVFAGEKHFDWIEVNLTDTAGNQRRLRFIDDRDESSKVVVTLAPGDSAHEIIDLAAWAWRKPNGKAPLAAGNYNGLVVYDSSTETKTWAGRFEARTSITIP
jgi:hypothetical protein